MDTSNLVTDLSYSLREELQHRLTPGEEMVVLLPGSFGEALAVTNRRALILRERNSGSGIEVFIYPRTSIAGANAVASGTGGYVELKLAEPPKNTDEARVYFPSYDLSKFQSAAEAISVTTVPAAISSPVHNAANPNPAAACPDCGTLVWERDIFCANCGKQLRAICAYCESASPIGSAFCVGCGTKMVEFAAGCPKCKARGIRRWMTFCPECGSILGAKCAACGMHLVEGMKFCPSCGRQPGSDTIDPSALRRVRDRVQSAATAQPSAPSSEAVVFTTPQALTAAEHNNRGREAFESERLDEAIKEFEQAIKMEPMNGSYHCNLAVAYDEAERDDDALAEYQRTLELEPNDLTALLSLGYLHSERDEADKARETWSKILVISPDSPEAQEARDNIQAQEQL